MPSFSKPIVFFFIYIYLISCSFTLDAKNINDAFDFQNDRIEDILKDTTRINQLFELGYEFIDGPSDSLLYYFEKALVIIQNNLDEIQTNQLVNQEVLKIYQKLKIRTFIEFGIEYFYQNNYKQALEHYTQALEIAKLIEDSELISECNSEIGIVYKNQGNYNRALVYYNQAFELAKQTTDKGWIASCQVNIGNVYKEQGFLSIAQKHYLEALKIMESLGENRRIAACYQNIGDIYHQQNDNQKALEYFNKSLKLAKSTNDKVRELTVYLNIGEVYLQNEEFKTARGFMEKALRLYNETGYQHEKDNCYLLLGNTWFFEYNYEKALYNYKKALQISQSKDDKSSIAEVEGNLGRLYFQLKENTKAINLYKSSLQKAKKLGLLELSIEVNSNLAQLYEKLGQHNLAFLYYKDYSQLKDSLFNAEKYKAIKEMEIKYESEKKQQQLTLLTEKNEIQQLKLARRNRMLFALIAGILLLILIGYLLRSQNLLKSKHQALELEQRLFRSQMNPHFIFNSLIAIQSYIYKKEPLVASDYLARFAELVRLILENSRSEFVPLSKETDTLNAYLELQQLRFENKFNYTFQLFDEPEHETVLVPPMFAQPFVENAIEHGLRHKPDKGNITISYRVQNKKCMLITIEDDGVGREKAEEIEKKKEHHSLALSITKDRLKVLSKKYNSKFELKVKDLKNEDSQAVGTKIEIILPYKLN